MNSHINTPRQQVSRRFVKRPLFLFLLALPVAFLLKACANFFTIPIERAAAHPDEAAMCRAYYLLNIDGMKGLGHSALLLQDEQGEAQFFSYNGMQYNLWECLAGKAGVGKMEHLSLDAQELAHFLETGDLPPGKTEECDNFDRALYCGITREEYERILEHAQSYIEVGEEFERYYGDSASKAEAFSEGGDIPKYQIYTHNCDTVARELLALAKGEVAEYNEHAHSLFPGGSYRKMCRFLGEGWGALKLGGDSVLERLLSDY